MMSVVGVLFLPYSAWGHVSPMLVVAAELVGRGVPVRVVAGSAYRRAIEAVGAEAVVPAVGHAVRVPAGYRPSELAERGRLWQDRRIAGVATRRVLDGELTRDRPDVCVVDPHIRWAGRIVARHGVPVVPLWTTHARTMCHPGPVLVNALPELQPRRSRFGSDVHFVGPLSAGVPDCESGLFPGHVPRRTVVVVAVGTVFARRAEFFRKVIGSFADSGWTVILATAWLPVEQLGRLPRNVHAYRWIPQSAALRRAGVFLTHGGMNSVHEAILAGVPMILAPRTGEQRQTARGLYRLGVAEPMSEWGSLAVQAARLATSPQISSRIQQFSRRAIRAGGVARAVDVLADIVDTPR
jgi:UDP:flavonoid glycosyltransferase YjiC (YdhE family)